MFGYDIGATSGVLASLTSPELSGTDWYDLNSVQTGLVVSLSLAGALAGSLIALGAGNKLGRKTELLAASLFYGIAAIITATCDQLELMLFGRTLYGLGIGFAMHAAPAYIAETAPASVRGLLISCKEGAIVGGILLGYLVSYLVVDDVGGWRYILGTELPLALILGAGMASLPESPRWLLLSGRSAGEAGDALRRVQGSRLASDDAIEAEVQSMMTGVQRAGAADSAEALEQAPLMGEGASDRAGRSLEGQPSGSGGASGIVALFTDRRYRRPLWVGLSLMLFQQITGQPSVLYYSTQIFRNAGFAAGKEAAGVSLLLGFFKLGATLVAVASVEKLGRRPLLLGGVSAMVVSLLSLGAAQDAATSGGTASAWVCVVSLLLYVGAYQMSFGPISWLICGEVFPLQVRGQAIAAATFVNFSSNFLVSLALPSLQEGLGPAGTYYLFGAIGAVAVASIAATVPETKGKTLEEIEAMWGTGRS